MPRLPPPSFKGKKHSLRTRQLMSTSHAGQMPWNKGVSTPARVRVKQSVALKGRKQTLEHVQKRAAAIKGRVPWNKGKTDSPATLQKKRDAQKGKKLSAATRQKLQSYSPWNKGKSLSDVHRANIASANRGKKHSPVVIEKIRSKALARESERRRLMRASFVELGRKIEQPTPRKHSLARGKDPNWVLAQHEVTPHHTIESREARQLIVKAIERLSPLQAECMMHYYFGSESSIHSIANALGVSPPNVWRAIQVGHRRLQQNTQLRQLLD